LPAITPDEAGVKKAAGSLMQCFKKMDGTGVTQGHFPIKRTVPRLQLPRVEENQVQDIPPLSATAGPIRTIDPMNTI
jgi:hypothetical protein